ncbi:MAG: 8-amino-7-oxononanoate synthase [Balneolales bacterium]
MPLPSFIKKELEERKQSSRLRRLAGSETVGVHVIRDQGKFVNFSSNDYLGLACDDRVRRASMACTDRYGTGATASRLITGTGTYHLELESRLAEAMGTQAALLFNSGYQANATIIPALLNRSSLVLSDKLNHNSLLQGAQLSMATLLRYRHNDMPHLESLLKKNEGQYGRTLIVTESVFSMDGDRADLECIIKLAEAYGALVMVDEAHALGVLGRNGMGLCSGKTGIDLVMGTFGKSFGSFGAFAACSAEMRDYLVNFCGGFIYSTALPPGVIGAAGKSLELIPEMGAERDRLARNAAYLRKALKKLGFKTSKSDSPIIPILIGDEDETLSLSGYLQDQGMFAIAIRPPTVAAGSSRIRITLSALHTRQHIDELLNALINWNGRK